MREKIKLYSWFLLLSSFAYYPVSCFDLVRYWASFWYFHLVPDFKHYLAHFSLSMLVSIPLPSVYFLCSSWLLADIVLELQVQEVSLSNDIHSYLYSFCFSFFTCVRGFFVTDNLWEVSLHQGCTSFIYPLCQKQHISVLGCGCEYSKNLSLHCCEVNESICLENVRRGWLTKMNI